MFIGLFLWNAHSASADLFNDVMHIEESRFLRCHKLFLIEDKSEGERWSIGKYLASYLLTMFLVGVLPTLNTMQCNYMGPYFA